MKYFFSLILFINLLYASSEQLIINDNIDTYENFKISYLKDTSKSLGIQEIINSKDFKQISNKFSLGYSKDTVWIKLDVKNISDNKDFILSLNEHFYEKINMYYFDYLDNSWKKTENSVFSYLKQRDIQTPKLAFNLVLPKNISQTIYLEMDSKYSYFGNVSINTKEYFFTHQFLNIDTFFIFEFGVLFIIMIFNLFLWLNLKEKIFIYYVGYTFSALVYLINISGLLAYFDLQEYLYKMHVSVAFTIIFLSLFSLEYLEVKKHFKSICSVVKLLNILLFIFACLMFFEYTPWNKYLNYVIFLIIIILVITSLAIYKKGQRFLRYYIITIIIYFISVIIFILFLIGAIEYNYFNRYVYIFSFSFEVIVFSLILANRYNILKNKEIKTQNKFISLQKNQNKILAEEVSKQTISLKEANNRLSELLKERELLLKEVFHRVKNNFHMITGIIWFESKKHENKDIFTDLLNRINSMSKIHEILVYKSKDLKQIGAKNYLNDLLENIKESYKNKNFSLIYEIDEMLLEFEEALNLGVITNEIISNSIKHNNSYKNEIELYLSIKDNKVNLLIKDNGKGFLDENKKGLGLNLVDDFSQKLENSNYHFIFENGTSFILNFDKKENND